MMWFEDTATTTYCPGEKHATSPFFFFFFLFRSGKSAHEILLPALSVTSPQKRWRKARSCSLW